MAHRKSLAKTCEMLHRQQRFGEPGCQLQIFGSGGERVLGQLDNQRVVRGLAFALPVALRQAIILAACFSYFVVDQELGVVTKIDAAGILTGDRGQDVFAKQHSGTNLNYDELSCSDGASTGWANSIDRTSRKGTSSPSTRSIFWPDGYSRPSSSAAQSVILPSQTASSACFQENG